MVHAVMTVSLLFKVGAEAWATTPASDTSFTHITWTGSATRAGSTSPRISELRSRHDFVDTSGQEQTRNQQFGLYCDKVVG